MSVFCTGDTYHDELIGTENKETHSTKDPKYREPVDPSQAPFLDKLVIFIPIWGQLRSLIASQCPNETTGGRKHPSCWSYLSYDFFFLGKWFWLAHYKLSWLSLDSLGQWREQSCWGEKITFKHELGSPGMDILWASLSLSYSSESPTLTLYKCCREHLG